MEIREKQKETKKQITKNYLNMLESKNMKIHLLQLWMARVQNNAQKYAVDKRLNCIVWNLFFFLLFRRFRCVHTKRLASLATFVTNFFFFASEIILCVCPSVHCKYCHSAVWKKQFFCSLFWKPPTEERKHRFVPIGLTETIKLCEKVWPNWTKKKNKEETSLSWIQQLDLCKMIIIVCNYRVHHLYWKRMFDVIIDQQSHSQLKKKLITEITTKAFYL